MQMTSAIPRHPVRQSSNRRPPAVNPNELNRYLADVKAQLEAVWKRLQAQAGLGDGGEAKVQFRISAAGVILSPVNRSPTRETPLWTN